VARRRSRPGAARAGVGWQLRAHPPPAPPRARAGGPPPQHRAWACHMCDVPLLSRCAAAKSVRSLSPILLPATCAHEDGVTPTEGRGATVRMRARSSPCLLLIECALRRASERRWPRHPTAAPPLSKSSAITITITRRTQHGTACHVTRYGVTGCVVPFISIGPVKFSMPCRLHTGGAG